MLISELVITYITSVDVVKRAAAGRFMETHRNTVSVRRLSNPRSLGLTVATSRALHYSCYAINLCCMSNGFQRSTMLPWVIRYVEE